MKNVLELLPVALYRFIREFIFNWSFLQGGLDKESFVCWRNFLNCSNSSYFRDIKYILIYYNLNDVHSRLYVQYYSSVVDEMSVNVPPASASRVSTVIRNVFASRQQISLKYLYYFKEETALNDVYIEQFADAFMSVHGVIFPGLTGFASRVLHYFQHYYFLSIRHCDFLRDVTALRNIEILDLSGCLGLENLGTLENCLELTLASTTIKGRDNLEKLTKVKKLILDDCVYLESPPSVVNEVIDIPERSIIDVSCHFQNQSLFFSRRLLVKDPSVFQNVQELCLKDCRNISDLSSFSHIRMLDIRGIFHIQIPLPEVNQLKILKLQGTVFYHVGIGCFPETQKQILQIHVYDTFFTWSGLSSSSVIDSEDSVDDNSSSLSSLLDFTTEGLYCLSFHHLHNSPILASTKFPSIRKLSLSFCLNIILTEKFPFLTDLTFMNLKQLKNLDFSLLPNLQNLTFKNYIDDSIKLEIHCLSLKRLFIQDCSFRKVVIYCSPNLQILQVRCSFGVSIFPIKLYGDPCDFKKLQMDALLYPILFHSGEKSKKYQKCIIS
jgi:hypothetical protein